ncbi:MAG: hypothetical protein KA338_26345, partial [Chloroflexi bacterium]|nr:hypothetical protein [Chloroflexota bacterium]
VTYIAYNRLKQPANPTPLISTHPVVTVLNPAPTPLDVTTADVLLQDDFSGTNGSWALSPIEQAEYRDGALVLHDRHFSDFGWARPHLQFENYVLDVDTVWVGGAVGGVYGVYFGYQDEVNFYAFTISNDGYYTISRQIGGQEEILVNAFTNALHPARAFNHLRLEANGSSLRFFINDTYLTDLTETGLLRGDIVFIAQKIADTESFIVAFDNLVVHHHPVQ